MWTGCGGSAPAAGVASCANADAVPRASMATTASSAVQTDRRIRMSFISTPFRSSSIARRIKSRRNGTEPEDCVGTFRIPLNRKGTAPPQRNNVLLFNRWKTQRTRRINFVINSPHRHLARSTRGAYLMYRPHLTLRSPACATDLLPAREFSEPPDLLAAAQGIPDAV